MRPSSIGVVGAAVAIAVLAASCSRTPSTPEARRARGLELVAAAGKHIASAQTISLKALEESERVRRSGTKVPIKSEQEMQIRRPDRMHWKAAGNLDLESFYDGQRVTLMSHGQKVYAVAPETGTLDQMIDDASERYDIPLPLSDVVTFTAAERLVNEDTTGGWVADETLDGKRVAKVAWQHPNMDWTIWVALDGPPLLHKMDLLYKARRGSPRRTYTFSDWQFGGELPDSVFAAQVPQDYEGIPIVQRASAFEAEQAPTPDAQKGKE